VGSTVTLLDGPMGTELSARGVDTALPLWSARALRDAPHVVSSIHQQYAAAGATIHTANTFRTKRRNLGSSWEAQTHLAVSLARNAIPAEHRVAGSIAPLEDCYRPDLSPRDARHEHREMARALARASCDLLLCETFPHVGEALVATEEAVATGLPTWVSFTAGPNADLLSPDEVARAAERALGLGATAVLVNCIPAVAVLPFVVALCSVAPRVGAYGNAGRPHDRIGWASGTSLPEGPARHAELALGWIAAGCRIVGACCGTGPAHIAELRQRLTDS